MDVRIRFGRVSKEDRIPKNTLVTIRKDDTVYFGISRCRLNADRVSKEAGKTLARKRADIAASGVADAWERDGSFVVHKSGVFGQVKIVNIQQLLKYFDNIDTIRKERALKI